jgi:hypothetical protein
MVLVQFDEADRVKRVGHAEPPSGVSYTQFIRRWAKGEADGMP